MMFVVFQTKAVRSCEQRTINSAAASAYYSTLWQLETVYEKGASLVQRLFSNSDELQSCVYF
jgi:hypothetical protein